MLYKIISAIIMLMSLTLWVMLITHSELELSLNSTQMYGKITQIYYLRNLVADFLLQTFSYAIYIIIIVFIVWSYLLFVGLKIKFALFKIMGLLYLLISTPYLLYYFLGIYDGGIIGKFLAETLMFPSYFVFCGLLINIAIFFSVLSIQLHFYKNISTSLLRKIIGKSQYLCSLIMDYYSNKVNKKAPISDKVHSSKMQATPDIDYILSKQKEVMANTSINMPHQDNSLNQHIKEHKIFNFDNLVETNNAKLPKQDNLEVKLESLADSDSNPNSHAHSNEDDINIKIAEVEEEKNNLANLTPTMLEESSIKIEPYSPQELALNNNISSLTYNVPLSFLQSSDNKKNNQMSPQEIKEVATKLAQIISEFNIDCTIVNIESGPVVTLYEITIPAGVKSSKVISLETDIALRMGAVSVRIAIVPGKEVIGIEIPNKHRQTVYFKDIMQSDEFQNSTAKLPLGLGCDINGRTVVQDLSTMPHVLIAGTTGSGKSVGINGMILSLLYKLSPDQCKLIMVDPKMLELSIYQDIPHLLTPVVTDPKQAVGALKWVVKEMEYRYYQMSLLGVRNIIGFNEKISNTENLRIIQEKLLVNQGIPIEFKHMPYIVVVIDEMADLMIVAGKEVEVAVQRLAQMARASGIHLVMATQRPSVDVITGTIKANFPTRMSFQVSSKIDSRTILGEQGAEQLLGRGDMLYMSGVGRIQRIHGPFINDDEVGKIVDYLKSLGEPSYVDSITNFGLVDDNVDEMSEKDELYDAVIDMIQQEGKVSTSFIQRRFNIGYNRAAKIVEQLEYRGVVSKATATGKREILL